MENKLKISVLVAVAFVAGIVGTISFANFDSPEQISTQKDNNDQTIGIGAFVTAEAYHADGTLYQKWEGHNNLLFAAQNALVGCISGLDSTPGFGFSCTTGYYDVLGIGLQNQTDLTNLPSFGSINTITPNESGLPEGCIFDVGTNDRCTGWRVEGTFDFTGLDCESGVSCYNATQAYTAVNVTVLFNQVAFDEIPIGPDDRLIIKMDFSIPT